ncbi:MAG: DNA mismatch repair endonuclease MutL [Phycisphaerae bacterium]|nr:DNA mismatch repair endonuclease MutL [Phycisphaerae bacterium]
MGQIKVLDQNMINMIAAGEVIERPASVVKELMENSIDAGATKITVSIEDGGRKLISVTDDGCGMDGGDLAAAFEPHATSKLKTSEDLQGISTLGFRGEALASIASISQVKAVSRMKDSPGASCVEVDCGDKSDVSPASADYGTTIQVRDIFYKLPARRKFLRTANTEMEHITEHFIRIALANDGLDMALYHNGKEIYLLSGGQGVRGRIAELFSSYEFGEDLIETESSEKDLHISALLGKPSISRTNSKFQYVFLNGRFIRDKFISHAIKEAYRGCIEPNRFPVVFLFIKMPYENYDVNVHPTKIEVRFYNANLVHSQVLGALREKLLGTDLQMQARMPSGEGGVSSAGYRSGEVAGAMAEFFRKHQTVQTQRQFGVLPKNQFVLLHPAGGQTYSQTMQSQYVGAKEFLQIHDSFIIAEADDGFIIVDQHALHERIMYEELCRRVRESNLESQKLLIPESFELTDAQANALGANTELLEKLGIEITPFGPKTYAIQAFPSLLSKASPLDFVRDLLDLLTDKGLGLDAEGLLDEVLNMAACKAAIKAGQKLSDNEIEQLLADKDRTERVSRCPHGRPTVIKFTSAELEKQFGRK